MIRSVSLLVLMTVASAVAEREITNTDQIRKLLSGRQLEQEDNQGSQGVATVEGELMNYSLKLFKCISDESLAVSDDGTLNYGVAVIRACPKKSCSSSTQGGCKSGYAEFAVPLSDFVNAYYQDLNDGDGYSQCTAYEQDANGNQYYVGPACTRDGKDIKLGLFKDAYCQQEVDNVKGIDTSALAYSNGGMVDKQCLACGENGDYGYQLKEMCATLYEDAKLKCESWSISHYYWDSITEVYRFGRDTTGCKRIAWMDKSPAPFTEWGTIFVLSLLLLGSIAGGVYYTIWWKKRTLDLLLENFHNVSCWSLQWCSHFFVFGIEFILVCFAACSCSDKANLEKIDYSESYDHSNPDMHYENADDYDMPDKAGIMT